MPATREAIYQAVFELGAAASWGDPVQQFAVASRRLKLWGDTPAQPAFYQAEHGESLTQTSNLPYKRIFKVNWVVYQNTGLNPDVSPTVENNNILDALENVLAPKPLDRGYPQRNTLGGLVYHCFIDGPILKVPGDIDDQAMMVIPITMLVP